MVADSSDAPDAPELSELSDAPFAPDAPGLSIEPADPQLHVRRTNRPLVIVGGIVVLGFVAVLVAGHRSDFPDAWRAVRDSSIVWLVVMVAAMLAAFVNYAMFNAAAQRAAALDTRPLELLQAATVSNFFNRVTKSGGLAGLAPITAHARRTGRALPPVVAAYLLMLLVSQWTFAVTLVVTLVIMWATGNLFAAEIIASLVFAVFVTAQVVAVVAAWRSLAALERLYEVPSRLRARITRRPARPVDTAAVAEFSAALAIIRRRPRDCLVVAAHGFVVELCGIIQLYAAIAAVGEGRRLTPALVAYSIGLLFSIVGFLPGGIGFVEVSATAALVSFGVAGGPAAAAVVMYRLVELWIPVAVGGLLALRLRRATSRSRAGSP
ncbi:MAG: hypothetical protein JWM12_123 [Ilumatobacteraceae bacterium]|nr:hypothetical protein [Ilumatobacteraceae bacterium]